eukprot:7787441-Pyramimonas_sp.AAC.1
MVVVRRNGVARAAAAAVEHAEVAVIPRRAANDDVADVPRLGHAQEPLRAELLFGGSRTRGGRGCHEKPPPLAAHSLR